MFKYLYREKIAEILLIYFLFTHNIGVSIFMIVKPALKSEVNCWADSWVSFSDVLTLKLFEIGDIVVVEEFAPFF